MHRLGILLSGRGSNFLAIATAIREHRLRGAEIAVVLSNLGLAAARELKLPAFAIPSAGHKRTEHDAEMIARLHQHKVDLVCLAGLHAHHLADVCAGLSKPHPQRSPIAAARLPWSRRADPRLSTTAPR